MDVSLTVLAHPLFHSLAVALLSTNLSHTRANVTVLVCAMTSKYTILVTIERLVLGGVLGCYIQGGVTFKGDLLFSIYGMCITR